MIRRQRCGAFVDLGKRVLKNLPLLTINTVAGEGLERLSPEFAGMYAILELKCFGTDDRKIVHPIIAHPESVHTGIAPAPEPPQEDSSVGEREMFIFGRASLGYSH